MKINAGKRGIPVLKKGLCAGILSGLITVAVVLFIAFYFLLCPLNIQAPALWWLLIVTTGLFALCLNLSTAFQEKRFRRIFLIPLLILAGLIICSIISSKMLNAKSYASIITVEDADFADDLEETLDSDSIALMDTDSAQMLGDREIGTLSSVVSQYDVSGDYTQIDYNGAPLKVSALAYAGFFKWVNNRESGVPGYVTVNPVTMSASYVEVSEGMIYVPSACFGEYVNRYIWKHYPTLLLDAAHFEVDEEGNPFYVTTVYKRTICVFGGKDVAGAIILDPVTGDLQYYDVEDVPQWVDVVYPGNLICTQYNWYGKLSNGYFNSLIAKKGCKMITEYVSDADEESEEDDTPSVDYGYVSKDGDIWIYTGVTSVNNDSSNIGFILSNERTGETHYYSIAGADEKSAMNAAEGEVQEKGYQASFPSLINVDGNPTYIMVLKDASGLVKLYAAVNVEQYNIVTTASTQAECIEKYRVLMGTAEDADDGSSGSNNNADGAESADGSDTSGGSDSTDTSGNADGTGAVGDSEGSGTSAGSLGDSSETAELAPDMEGTIVISDIRLIDIDGNTYCYLLTDENGMYRIKVADQEDVLFLEAGDEVYITASGKEILSISIDD